MNPVFAFMAGDGSTTGGGGKTLRWVTRARVRGNLGYMLESWNLTMPGNPIAVLALAIVVLGAPAAGAQNDPAVDAATGAARAWIARSDAGDYGGSYDQAARFFRDLFTRDQFIELMETQRRPLGAPVDRTLSTTQFETTLPEMPDGQYVILQFNTNFENRRGVTEIVVMTLEGGDWKTTTYVMS